ncbi:hypothetical protein RCOM_0462760 [Ricinus communis]|uniref:Uncharacterized protein n=2 Tax=Ricinus communis TaxID=3988 RepID=B9T1R5_RICCO|nr:hypothetical protein RCOM_0462760 [Ricinus communis]|eukprot:XP_025015395.1 cation/H(+) antiporter 20-like [Ricinus communis]
MWRSRDHDLIVIGKGRFPSTKVAELADHPTEHPELGPIGDVLASSEKGIVSSVLAIQQHDLAHQEEGPPIKVVRSHNDKLSANGAYSSREIADAI